MNLKSMVLATIYTFLSIILVKVILWDIMSVVRRVAASLSNNNTQLLIILYIIQIVTSIALIFIPPIVMLTKNGGQGVDKFTKFG